MMHLFMPVRAEPMAHKATYPDWQAAVFASISEFQ
jgi:hypothetical protein